MRNLYLNTLILMLLFWQTAYADLVVLRTPDPNAPQTLTGTVLKQSPRTIRFRWNVDNSVFEIERARIIKTVISAERAHCSALLITEEGMHLTLNSLKFGSDKTTGIWRLGQKQLKLKTEQINQITVSKQSEGYDLTTPQFSATLRLNNGEVLHLGLRYLTSEALGLFGHGLGEFQFQRSAFEELQAELLKLPPSKLSSAKIIAAIEQQTAFYWKHRSQSKRWSAEFAKREVARCRELALDIIKLHAQLISRPDKVLHSELLSNKPFATIILNKISPKFNLRAALKSLNAENGQQRSQAEADLQAILLFNPTQAKELINDSMTNHTRPLGRAGMSFLERRSRLQRAYANLQFNPSDSKFLRSRLIRLDVIGFLEQNSKLTSEHQIDIKKQL